MAYLGTLVFLVAAVGAFLYWRRRLERARWFLWIGMLSIAFPYLAALSGWVLTEVGRQPWIVQGLLRTADANSPNVSTGTIATSLGVFAALYVVLAGRRLRAHAPVRPHRPTCSRRRASTRRPPPAVSY